MKLFYLDNFEAAVSNMTIVFSKYLVKAVFLSDKCFCFIWKFTFDKFEGVDFKYETSQNSLLNLAKKHFWSQRSLEFKVFCSLSQIPGWWFQT